MNKFLDSNQYITIGFIISVCLLVFFLFPSPNLAKLNPILKEDFLVYVVTNDGYKNQLIHYGRQNNIHTPIVDNVAFDGFVVNPEMGIAYSQLDQSNSDIYLLPEPFETSESINITNNEDSKDRPLSWSSDGRYLAYISEIGKEQYLMIWDGKQSTPIYFISNRISELDWSTDNKLAFTVFSSSSYPSEIFIWDGQSTILLSQNPSGEDRYPAWNENGELAFLSERDDEYDIFIWDGVSFKNGQPDVASFENVMPSLTEYYSSPVWTTRGTLSFNGGLRTGGIAIFEWNGKVAEHTSNNRLSHNGGQVYRDDGYWAFVTFLSDRKLLYIRNQRNQSILVTRGSYPPAWSKSGDLVFCEWSDRQSEWILNVWDGREHFEIARGNTIRAIWQNGSGVYCSNG